MQPHNLTIQAFGPFSNTQTINFESLGSAPLFLINGATGSGKSSILDAMCYALYGETTGNERTGDQMRCDYAKPDLVTEISFEFSLGSKVLKVTRSPEQWLPKKRGEGKTKRVHKASLVQMNDGDESLISSRTTEVNKHLLELIGLNVKQFRQVMVLPQGRFRELLTASSKEREVIFGQLFQTHIYNSIEKALYDQTSEIRNQKERFDNQIKGALNSAGVESEKDLEQQTNSAAANLDELQKLYVDSKNRHEQAILEEKNATEMLGKFSELDEIKLKLKAHLDAKAEYDKQTILKKNARSAQYLTDPYKKVQNAERLILSYQTEQANLSDQVSMLTSVVGESQASLDKANEEYSTLSKHEQELSFLHAIQQKLERISEVTKHQEAVTSSLESAQVSLQEANSTIEGLNTRLNEKQKQLELANFAMSQLPEKKHKVERLNAILVQFDRKHELCSQRDAANEKTRLLATQLIPLEAKVEDSLTKANDLEYSWHCNQAAILASQLKIGEACPVCGSAEHPSVAEFFGEEVSLPEVEQAKKQYQELLKQASEHREILNQQRLSQATVEQKLASVEEYLQSNSNGSDEHVKRELDKLLAEVNELESDLIPKLQKELHRIQAELDSQNQDKERFALTVKNKEHEAAAIEAQLIELRRDVPKEWMSIQALQNQLQVVEQTLFRIKEQHKKAEQAFQQATSNLTQVCAKQQQLDNLMEKAGEELQEFARIWENKLNDSPFDDVQQFQAYCLTQQELESIDQYLRQYQDTLASLNALQDNLSEELSGIERPQLAAISQTRNECQQKEKDMLLQVTTASSRVDRLRDARQSLTKLQQENAQLEKAYQVVGTLSDVANGKTGSKVSLHRFVLGVLLDDVLILASKRLNKMTQGRYNLKRKREKSKGNAGSGLELMVEDGYTGKWRDVATLSGGESFMAALSLALGLSDVVQSYSGGIRLDTLFIDEGFGSLDQESLDLAIQALIDLQQGGRTIGIISHVSELKEQLALRVDVISGRYGSEIKVLS
ncbi:SMC family ATPase [Vibrio sp. S4M6]|uniref:AAA family ATPase n=1 Tax=Vibrio sinus TaxID=2946865 RepID=UPI00202A6FFE|nr:SMC family ATPase [Vibrio sinus]MCL9779959.1 SMC family ATPase [Vibrio sinus]